MLFGELNQVLIESMTNLQREANRDFAPTIANIMHTVYEACTDEHGKGSFLCMKGHMAAYVEASRHSMFNKATMTVKHHLDDMCRQLQEVMEARADEIYVRMKADYMRVLGGVLVRTEASMSLGERDMRADTTALLNAVDDRFAPIAQGEADTEDNASGGILDESTAFPSADSTDEEATASVADSAVLDSMTQDSAMQDLMVQDSMLQDIGDGSSLSAEKQSCLPTPRSNSVSETEL